MFSAISVGNVMKRAMTTLSAPQLWKKVFVPTLESKFENEVVNYQRWKHLLLANNGRSVLDHGASRVTDPASYKFLVRVAEAFGLRGQREYEYRPTKPLTAADFQLPGEDSFKWYITLCRAENLSPAARQLVLRDRQENPNIFPSHGWALLEKLERDGSLPQSEGQQLTDTILDKYFKRHGQPLARQTLQLVEKESLEFGHALLFGPGFNHITPYMNECDVEGWTCLETLSKVLKEHGFKMLADIQGDKRGILRQTSILAEDALFPVKEADGKISQVVRPGKYIEFIFRGILPKTGQRYMNFIRTSADKLYESTRM